MGGCVVLFVIELKLLYRCVRKCSSQLAQPISKMVHIFTHEAEQEFQKFHLENLHTVGPSLAGNAPKVWKEDNRNYGKCRWGSKANIPNALPLIFKRRSTNETTACPPIHGDKLRCLAQNLGYLSFRKKWCLILCMLLLIVWE